MRICLDPKYFIICENYKVPTLEEIAHVLTGATRFSKEDGNKAFFVFIYGKDDKEHDAYIINLFNVAQKERLIFNSKMFTIKQESVM